MINILFVDIVEDDSETAETIGELLAENGIKDFQIFNDPDVFLKSETAKRVCIIDYRFNGSTLTALEIIEKVIDENERCKIILITGVVTDPGTILKLVNIGAFKYLIKGDAMFDSDLVKYTKQAMKLAKFDMKIEQFASKRLTGNDDGDNY